MAGSGTTGDYLPTTVPIVAVVGATASGKTGLSLDLAERLHGEVVNTDAMQVYQGMDVGTAKLPPDRRRGIPHHLLDTLTVREPATVAEFQRWARDVIDAAPRAAYDARPRRRVRALHASGAGPVRVPRHGSGHPRPVGAGARGARCGRPPPAAGRSRSRGGRADPPRERPAHRPRAGGDRADRPAVQREPAGDGVRRPAHRPDRCRHRPGDARPADRRAGRRHVRRRVRRRGPPPPAPRPGRRAYGAASDRLPRGRRAMSAGSSPRQRPASGRRRPPDGSLAGRTRGSGRTRAWSGSGTTTRLWSARRSTRSRGPDVGGCPQTRHMARTTYYTAMTLDGFLADEHDSLDWLFVQDQDEQGPRQLRRVHRRASAPS